MKKWNAFQLKLFMAALMVLDHLNIVPGLVSPTAAGIFHLVTRCVAPWFAFLAVEGFLHTRNQIRYNVRLFLWAVFMQTGNLILNLYYGSAGVFLYNNIFLTLAFGVLLLNLLFHKTKTEEIAPRHKKSAMALRIIAAILTIIAGIFFTEGGTLLLPFFLLTYLLRENPRKRNLSYGVLSLLLFIALFQWYPGDLTTTIQMLLFNSDWAFLLVIPFFSLYNGKRGDRKSVV